MASGQRRCRLGPFEASDRARAPPLHVLHPDNRVTAASFIDLQRSHCRRRRCQRPPDVSGEPGVLDESTGTVVCRGLRDADLYATGRPVRPSTSSPASSGSNCCHPLADGGTDAESVHGIAIAVCARSGAIALCRGGYRDAECMPALLPRSEYCSNGARRRGLVRRRGVHHGPRMRPNRPGQPGGPPGPARPGPSAGESV
jgi:hypothetical protein